MKEEVLKVTDDDYAAFYANYVGSVEEGTCSDVLNADTSRMQGLFLALDDEKGNETYAPGKWSVKNVIQHIMDAERIFATRALMISRGEAGSISGYDHNAYAQNVNADERSMKEIEREWFLLRSSTQALFESFNTADFQKRGMANEQPISVAALAYIIAGHSIHHLNVLSEKYGLVF